MEFCDKTRVKLDLFSESGEAGAQNSSGENTYSADAGQGTAANGGKSEFEELISGKFKDDFQKKTQTIIDGRFKKMKSLEEYKSRTEAVLGKISEKYGIDDFDALLDGEAEIVSNEDTPDDGETEITEQSGADVEDENDTDRGAPDEALEYFGALLNEQEMVKELYPSFDIRRELAGDERFARLIAGGMGMREAYEAVHHGELLRDAMAYAAKTVREQTSRNIEQRSQRPLENGLLSKSGIVTKTNVNALTSGDILKILKQVENGEKISF